MSPEDKSKLIKELGLSGGAETWTEDEISTMIAEAEGVTNASMRGLLTNIFNMLMTSQDYDNFLQNLNLEAFKDPTNVRGKLTKTEIAEYTITYIANKLSEGQGRSYYWIQTSIMARESARRINARENTKGRSGHRKTNRGFNISNY
jgi:hypothetical protein